MASPRPINDSWIVVRGELTLVCPNGCCTHTAHVSGAPVPDEWRYATQPEVDAGRSYVLFGLEVATQLADMKPQGSTQ